MRTLSLIAGAALAALTLSTAGAASAQTAPRLITANDEAPAAQLIFGRDTAGQPGLLQDAQFLFGGRNYCWYDGGWRGPGYYWCGYAWRRGYGWGGPVGWHGWGRGGAGYHGGYGGGYHGGGNFHGGGGAHPAATGGFHGGGGHAPAGGGHAGGGGHGGGGDHHH